MTNDIWKIVRTDFWPPTSDLWLFSTNELIATAVDGKYETRLLGIRFQLLPEMDDVRIDCARVRIVVITPHRIQQPVAAKRFRWMSDEVSEQRKLFCRELDWPASASDFIAADVDLDIAESINLARGRLLRHASQHSFHP